MRRVRSFRPMVEPLEQRRLLASIADAGLFGPAQTVNASSTNPNAAFATANVVNGTNAAFLFGDGTGPQRLAISNFDAAINTLRFFDTPSYFDRAASAVTIYYSAVKQLSLLPANYISLGSFSLPTTNLGGTAQGDVYQTATNPADHPRSSDPGASPGAVIHYDQLTGLNIPAGTQSILLDFGANPAGIGFGFTEIDAFGVGSSPRPATATLLGWGQNVYQKINASLQVMGSHLYAETVSLSGTQSGGDSGFAYVWPEATMFRVLDDLVSYDPTTYTPIMRAFSDELYTRYWQNSGHGGYRSGVSSGATLFYDDNAHVVVALVQAYNLTGDPVYLSRAIQTYQFVLSGEDSAGGGGIYFSVPDKSQKNAISTLQEVRAGLLLYELTGQTQYLSDATRLYTWAATHIQQSNGLFYQEWALTGANAGTPQGVPLINGAGIGLSCNLLFYDVTGTVAYLREAQLIGTTSIPRYFNSSGAINDEGYWDFELVDALGALYLDDRNPTWLNDVTGALTWLHANREDPNGHYGTLWARDNYTPGTVRTSWNMIDQAAVADSYLHTAELGQVPPPGVTAPGDAIGGFYQGSVGASDVPSTVGSGAGQYPSGFGPANAIDANTATAYFNYGNGGSSVSSVTKGVGTGFYVTPALGPSIVTGIQVTTSGSFSGSFANRDPLTVSIEGTNATGNFDTGATWTLIANNVDLGIDTDPGRGVYGPLVRFSNATPYRSYRVIVQSQRGSDIGVEYAELNLLGTAAPLGQYQVAVVGPSPVTAGHGVVVSVQAADSSGNSLTSYSGPATVTATISPTGGGAPFTTTVSINSKGLGLFLANEQVAGTYTIAVTDSSGMFTGSVPLTVTAGLPARTAFALQPVNTPTGTALPPVSVQLTDSYGNIVNTDNSDPISLSIASGPGSFTAGSTRTATVTDGVATFNNLTLAVPGVYTLSAVVPGLYTGPASTAFTITPLQVVPGSFAGTPAGFSLQFNTAFLANSAALTLYGQGFPSAAPVPSVTLTQTRDAGGNAVNNPIAGSLLLNPATNSITFLATDTTLEVNNGSPLLPDGAYTAVVHSSANSDGFQALYPGGGFLDGLGSGVAGSGDFTATFSVTAAASHDDVLWLPDTAEGPGQALNAPGMNRAGGGYPVYLGDGTGSVTDVQATLTYNPALLTVTPSSTATFSVTVPSAGTALLHYSGPALARGSQTPIGFLTAMVPTGTASSPVPYKATDLLHLSAVTINQGAIPVATSDGLHLVAYVGDADGNGSYSSSDAVLITRAVLRTDSGFAAYGLVDPVIVADTDGSGFLPADAALQVSEAGVGLPTANLPNPPIPTGVHFQAISRDAVETDWISPWMVLNPRRHLDRRPPKLGRAL
jgi:Glycosyl hydrolase family 76